MHYILFYKTVEGYVEKRAPDREEHLKLAQAPATTAAWSWAEGSCGTATSHFGNFS